MSGDPWDELWQMVLQFSTQTTVTVPKELLVRVRTRHDRVRAERDVAIAHAKRAEARGNRAEAKLAEWERVGAVAARTEADQ